MILTALLENLPLIIGGLVQVVAGIVIAIPQIFASMIESIVNVFVGIWNALKNVFGQLGTWIYNNVAAPILSFAISPQTPHQMPCFAAASALMAISFKTAGWKA